MDPWEIRKEDNPDHNKQIDSKNLHYILSSSRQATPCGSTKRVVYPAVPFMTVKEERKCLSEIRNYCGSVNVPENFSLSNGMKAEDFALMYVLGHQLKRKEKETLSSNQD